MGDIGLDVISRLLLLKNKPSQILMTSDENHILWSVQKIHLIRSIAAILLRT
jgi:hypothetical protein